MTTSRSARGRRGGVLKTPTADDNCKGTRCHELSTSTLTAPLSVDQDASDPRCQTPSPMLVGDALSTRGLTADRVRRGPIRESLVRGSSRSRGSLALLPSAAVDPRCRLASADLIVEAIAQLVREAWAAEEALKARQ